MKPVITFIIIVFILITTFTLSLLSLDKSLDSLTSDTIDYAGLPRDTLARAPIEYPKRVKGQNFKVTYTITYNSITLQEAADLEKAIRASHRKACKIEVDLETCIEEPSWYPNHSIIIDSVTTIDRGWYIDSSRVRITPERWGPFRLDTTNTHIIITGGIIK